MLSVARDARPEERLTPTEAAAKYIYINQPGSYVGQFDPDYTPYMKEPSDTLASREFTGLVFVGPVQCGKALDVSTPILTSTGWKTMGGLRVGDTIFAPDGTPTEITFATEFMYGRDCYEVSFDDGSSIVADADHQWMVKSIHRAANEILTTSDILKRGVRSRKQAVFSLPETGPIITRNEDALWVEPYLLGYWLGDGCRQSGYITVGAADVSEFIRQMNARGHSVVPVNTPHGKAPRFRVVPGNNQFSLVEQLRRTGLRENLRRSDKRVPSAYLMAPPDHRRELLRGLLDADGHWNPEKNRVEFSSSERCLSEAVLFLARSLGFRPRLRIDASALHGKQCKPRHRVFWTTYDPTDVFSFARKTVIKIGGKTRPAQTTRLRIASIRPVETRPVRCIQVNHPSHLFLAGEGLVPTHNTQMFQSWHAYGQKIEPADMIVYQMTQTAASDFTISRIDPLHRNNPAIGKLLLKGSTSNSNFRKMFRNGSILRISWPSPTEFASKSVPRVFLTDYDRMPQDVGGEGSPFDLAEKRTTTYRRNAMCAAESTPSFPVTDLRWTQPADHPHEAPPCDGIIGLYNRGDRRRWYWQCVSCHMPFEPDFSLMKWPDSADRLEAAEAAYMACPHCGQVYEHGSTDDAPGKNEMNLNHARWIKEGQIWQPDGRITGVPRRSRYASFWLKGPAARFQPWSVMVFEYLTAKDQYDRTGDETNLQSTVNTRQALPYRPQRTESLRTPEEIMARARDFGTRVVPEGVRFLIATIDVQKSKFVVQVHGIGYGNDKWVIDRFNVRVSKRPDEEAGGFRWVMPGSYPEDWNELVEHVLLKSYPLADGSGRHMPIKFTLCDSGGQDGVTKNAYAFYRRLRNPPVWDDADPTTHIEIPPGLHNRFQLLIGRPKPDAPRYQITYPDAQRKDRHAGARGDIPVARINSDLIKNELDHALDRTEPRGGRINFPNWLSADFYNELCAEARDDKGKWEKIGQYRNESWDLLAYCLAACLDNRIGLEKPNFWTEPPSWAEEWEANDFIFNPTTGKSMVEGPPVQAFDFKKLGSENA
jgi:phage terminase large subunit GpA-like protein